MWFESYTRALLSIEEPELQLEFALAVAEFGTYGKEPEFKNWALKSIFEGIRPNIESSRRNSKNGKAGAEKRWDKEKERRKEQEAAYTLPAESPEEFKVPDFIAEQGGEF